jgi:hypothetical protein
VDPPLGLGHRHALHAVNAALEAQERIDALPAHQRDDLLEAAGGCLREVHDLDLPALALGVTREHPEQIGGEQRRFLATFAAADLDDGVALVVGILGQQQHVDRFDETRALGLEARQLLLH